MPRAIIPSFASATSFTAPNLYASKREVLMVINFASLLKRLFEPVVKSEKRVPMPRMTSAHFAISFPAELPVTPSPPRFSGSLERQAVLPLCVSAKGMPNDFQNISSASPASEYLTPPPQITSGFSAFKRISAISLTSSREGTILVILCTLFARNSSGKS